MCESKVGGILAFLDAAIETLLAAIRQRPVVAASMRCDWLLVLPMAVKLIGSRPFMYQARHWLQDWGAARRVGIPANGQTGG